MEDLEKCPIKKEDIITQDNPKTTWKAFQLDDNDNIVDSGESTRTVMGEYDEDGTLIREIWGWSSTQFEKLGNVDYNQINEKVKVSREIRKVLNNFVDQNGNHIFRKTLRQRISMKISSIKKKFKP